MGKLLIAAAPALLILVGCAPKEPAERTPATPAQPAEATRAATPEPLTGATPSRAGDVGVLRAGGGEVVLAGTTQAALDRLIQLSTARDGAGVARMVFGGQAMAIDDGTRARLIDPGILSHEVRVLEGPYAGRSAFIPSEFLRGR